VPELELPIILVFEDDDLIQNIVEEALTEGGFELAIAASGEEAVTLLQSGAANYRALVTDISLKGRIDGWEIAKKAREKDSAFPIVYMSGAHAEDWASKGVPNSIMLAKPFAPAQLITAVSQLLNAPTGYVETTNGQRPSHSNWDIRVDLPATARSACRRAAGQSLVQT